MSENVNTGINYFLETVNSLVFENYNVPDALLEFQQEDFECSADLVFISEDVPWLGAETKAAGGLAKMLANCLKECDNNIFLPELQSQNVRTILSLTGNAIEKDVTLGCEYSKMISNQKLLPLELLCCLQVQGILSVDTYLQHNITKSAKIGHFTESVVSLFNIEPKDRKRTRWMCTEMTSWLVDFLFGVRERTAIRQVCHVLLDSIISKSIVALALDTNVAVDSRVNVMEIVLENEKLMGSCKKSVAFYVHKKILTSFPVVKVSQALAEQHLWQYKFCSPFFVAVMQKSFTVVKVNDVVNLLRSLLDHQEVNWKMLLLFVSCALLFYRESAVAAIAELVEDMLRQAFAGLRLDCLIVAFLIGRQMCLETPPTQASYSHWFQKYFGESTTSFLCGSSPKNFAFLVRFLTSLIPHEQYLFLKIHVVKPPYMVLCCRETWSNYLQLARTRLKDLKNVAEEEEPGIYENVESLLQKQGDQAEEDVETAVRLFEESGKIPSTIFEASIFRKPYFSGRFLAALLKPRLMPEVPDARVRFIEALKQAGKIPFHFHYEYVSKCRSLQNNEKVKVTDAVFEHNCSSGPADLHVEFEILCERLHSLGDHSEVGVIISQMSVQLQSLASQQTFASNVVLNLDDPLVETVFFRVARAIVEMSEKASIPRHWEEPLVSMISCHVALHLPLAHCLWQHFASCQEVRVGIVALLQRIGTIFTKVQRGNAVGDLPSLIFDFLPVTTIAEREYFLDLCAKYLVVASLDKASSDSVPLLKKLQFSFLTNHPSCQQETQTKCAESYRICKDTVCNAKLKLTVEEWLILEAATVCELQPHKRMEILHFWVHDYFHSEEETHLREICCAIFAVLHGGHRSSGQFALLQELVLHLFPSDGCAWLSYYLEEKLLSMTGRPIVLQECLTSFFSLIVCLPPHLLFCDHTRRVSSKSFHTVSRILQEFVRDYLIEKMFLPKHITAHIWKGLLSLGEENREMISTFLELTPVLRAATIVHYRSIPNIQNSKVPYLGTLQTIFRRPESSHLACGYKLHKWELGMLGAVSVSPSILREMDCYTFLCAVLCGVEQQMDVALLSVASWEKYCRPKTYAPLLGEILAVVPSSCRLLYPSYILRILLQMQDLSAVDVGHFATVVLENYRECKRSVSSDTSFLVEIASRVKDVLGRTPRRVLDGLPRELWDECILESKS